MKKSNQMLAAVMAGSALLSGIGNLVIVNALQQQNLTWRSYICYAALLLQ